MQWFNDLGFKAKTTLPLILIGSVFLLSSILGIVKSRQIADDAEILGNVFLRQIDYLLQADRDLYQSLLAEQSLIYIDHNNQSERDAHKENLQQAKERGNKALSLGQIDNVERRKKEFNDLHEAWNTASTSVIRALDSNDKESAIRISRSESKQKFDALRHFIDVVQEEQIRKSEFYSKQASNRSQQATTTLFLTLVLGLLICVAILIFIPPLITRPLHYVTKQISNIAKGHGDLSARMTATSKDEIGVLAIKFNEFLEKLHAVISQTKACATDVSGAANDLAHISETNQTALQLQNQALDMVVSAVHEMSAAINEVAESTSATADQAKRAHERSTKGMQIVNNTVAEIKNVSNQVNSVAGLISDVEAQVTNVTSVLDVIRGIAEQTNLLALNAAIEAARAGEQGRGFAVVADEVRTLASRTQTSTTDIQVMLENLQNGVSNAVKAMEVSAESATKSVTTANDAGIALKEINESVSSITDMAVHIATAIEEQSTVIEDINRNLSAISDQATTTEENANKTANSSQHLGFASDNLMNAVGSFKL